MRSHHTDKQASPWRYRYISIAVLLVLGWLLVGGSAIPYLGKLTEVRTSDPSAFLPANAESTEVTQLREDFTDRDLLPTIVVFERDSGLRPTDSTAIDSTVEELSELELVVGGISGPVPSEDGAAAQVSVPLSGADPVQAAKAVQRMQDMVDSDLPAGLHAHVTGPGGYTAASAEAFGGIDGILLLVTAIAVAMILVLVYRSPLLPIVVLIAAGLALGVSSAVIYWLASSDLLTLNGQSQGILLILVFGAATDYALLLVARYREELQQHHSSITAMRKAVRASFAPILASGGTVILSMLCMLASDLATNKSLGPIVSIGVAAALWSSLTFLPAALLLLGRGAFWPRRPDRARHGAGHPLFDRVADLVGRRPRTVWIATALILLIGAAFVPSLDADGNSRDDMFLAEVEATTGQRVLAEHFPGGAGSPVIVMTERGSLPQALQTVQSTDGIASAAPLPADQANPQAGPKTVHGMAQVSAVLEAPADSTTAQHVVTELRQRLDDVEGADPKVGGLTAQRVDMLQAAEHDRNVIIPLVLIVVFLVLALLLRALIAPLLLILTVVLSFAATLGVGALVFSHLFGFPGTDPSLPLYAFVFLVALGIDYNIFLMTRARENAAAIGTERGTLRALRVTGGVITSAGLVLAATFAALSVLPVLFLVQIAFLVTFGVLLDTLIVRALLVPALAVDLGRIIWWPSKLARAPRGPAEAGERGQRPLERLSDEMV